VSPTLLLIVLLPLAPPEASAPPAADTVADQIATGRQHLDSLEYELAVDVLTIAATHPDATEPERVEANLYAGIANRVLGRDVDARLNFLYVLQVAPETELPEGTAPKIAGFYALVAREVTLTQRPAAAPVVQPEAADNAPSSPAPAAPDADAAEEVRWLLWSGVGVGGLGVALAMLAGGTAGSMELLLQDPSQAGGQRQLYVWTTWLALAALGVALPITALGAGLIVWGGVE
jgi:hypothetical protein